MNFAELQTLRAQLEAQSNDSLGRTLELLETSVRERSAELERLQALLGQRRAELAMAREVVAARPGLQDPEFQARWQELLDTLNRAPDRCDRLQLALREFMHGREPLIMQEWRVREDNRQAVLAVLVPGGADARQALYEHLLKLLPILVNEGHADPKRQAAVLSVRGRDLGDHEWLTLVAQPSRARFELLKAWRSEEETLFSGPTLREALDYIAEHYPYWG